MDSFSLYKRANALVQQEGTRDAERIAREIEVWIFEEPSFDKLLGMYTCRWNHRMIFLNTFQQEVPHFKRSSAKWGMNCVYLPLLWLLRFGCC